MVNVVRRQWFTIRGIELQLVAMLALGVDRAQLNACRASSSCGHSHHSQHLQGCDLVLIVKKQSTTKIFILTGFYTSAFSAMLAR
jgi:hypothetical protein